MGEENAAAGHASRPQQPSQRRPAGATVSCLTEGVSASAASCTFMACSGAGGRRGWEGTTCCRGEGGWAQQPEAQQGCPAAPAAMARCTEQAQPRCEGATCLSIWPTRLVLLLGSHCLQQSRRQLNQGQQQDGSSAEAMAAGMGRLTQHSGRCGVEASDQSCSHGACWQSKSCTPAVSGVGSCALHSQDSQGRLATWHASRAPFVRLPPSAAERRLPHTWQGPLRAPARLAPHRLHPEGREADAGPIPVLQKSMWGVQFTGHRPA